MNASPSAFTWTIQAEVTALGIFVTFVIYLATRARDRQIRQAELLRNYTNDFYEDDAMTAIFMDVDHDRYDFSVEQHGTDAELALIRLLDFFNVIGHNWVRGVVRLDTLVDTTIGYAALRLHADDQVSAYLRQIEQWDSERYAAGTGFGHFRELAVAIARYPSAPTSTSLRTRVAAAIRRSVYARTARFRSRVRAAVPRPVAVTVAEVDSASVPESSEIEDRTLPSG